MIRLRSGVPGVVALTCAATLGLVRDPTPGHAEGSSRPHGSHRDAPPPAHTGGFGEPTCKECHDEYPIDLPDGRLAIEGLPETYAPGERYPITVVLSADGTEVAGFQLAVRSFDGRQAGDFDVTGTALAVDTVQGPAGRVLYLRHARAATTADGSGARWSAVWIAPDAGVDLRVHAAANSANGDDSPLGDLVFTSEARVRGFARR